MFISRRLIILAAEDIGLANPNALLIANACADAVQFVGFPEARIILSEATIYLAVSSKSNSAYAAIMAAQQAVQADGSLPVPLSLRNAPTKLMKQLDYGKNYGYSHEGEGNFIDQEFLPEDISGSVYYKPSANVTEDRFKERLRKLWGDRYKY